MATWTIWCSTPRKLDGTKVEGPGDKVADVIEAFLKAAGYAPEDIRMEGATDQIDFYVRGRTGKWRKLGTAMP